jgi:hypothetical protein
LSTEREHFNHNSKLGDIVITLKYVEEDKCNIFLLLYIYIYIWIFIFIFLIENEKGLHLHYVPTAVSLGVLFNLKADRIMSE